MIYSLNYLTLGFTTYYFTMWIQILKTLTMSNMQGHCPLNTCSVKGVHVSIKKQVERNSS
jgi:hypothetical protein